MPDFKILTPSPPKLLSRSPSSIELQWKDCLPYAVGIITSIEIQYMMIRIQSQSINGHNKAILNEGVWNSLVTKLYSHSHFLDFKMDHLKPGTIYCFRMRFRCLAGWGEFSAPSEQFATQSEPPAALNAPSITAISPFSALVSWNPPISDNGSPIFEYILEGKSVGDDFVELYRGLDTCYLVFGLFPDFAYSFRVSASNWIGTSEKSKLSSIQIPSLATFNSPQFRTTDKELSDVPIIPGFSALQVVAALNCVQAWQEHWDPYTQLPFYFNVAIGFRQQEVPKVLQLKVDTNSASEVAVSPSGIYNTIGKQRSLQSFEIDEFIKGFRKKRFRLVRSLHNRRSSALGSRANERRNQGSSGSDEVSQRAVANNSESLIMRLRRNHILKDFCTQVLERQSSPGKLNNADFLKRIKIQFVGEEGIDGGGLAKEAFALLSKEFVRYGMSPSRQFLRTLSNDVAIAIAGDASQSNHRQLIAGGIFFAEDTVGNTIIGNELQLIQNRDNEIEDFEITRRDFGFAFGIFLGKAIMDRQLGDVPLSWPLLNHILGVYQNLRASKISANSKIHKAEVLSLLEKEMASLDITMSKSLQWIIENDNITDVIDETFSVTVRGSVVPLCARGETIIVTDETKNAYVYLMILWKLLFSIADIMESFLDGFYSIVPMEALKDAQISAEELSLMFNGKDSINVEELRAYVIYDGNKETFHECCPTIVWFWRIVREMDDCYQRKLLLFFTGSSRVPLDGYDPVLTISDGVDMLSNSLPKAHTCFNQLVIPRYTNFDTMKEKFLFAITNTEGFGLI
jgi:hypothetical protein